MTLFLDVGGIWRFIEENVTEEKRSRREEHAAMDSGNEPTNQLKSSSRDTIQILHMVVRNVCVLLWLAVATYPNRKQAPCA